MLSKYSIAIQETFLMEDILYIFFGLDGLYIKKHYKDEEDINLSSGFDKLNKVQASADLPAITHVDFTARLQTVSKKTNYKFHSLLNYLMIIL